MLMDRVRFGKSMYQPPGSIVELLVSLEMGALGPLMWSSSKLLFWNFLKGAPIVLSDSEEEEMIILEPEKSPKKIR